MASWTAPAPKIESIHEKAGKHESAPLPAPAAPWEQIVRL
jgi:hypothetical protein